MANKQKTGFVGGKFLPPHLGHTYLVISASNHVDKLYVVLTSSEKRDKELCKKQGIRYIPAQVRLSCLGQMFNDLDNIEIIHIKDEKGIEDYDWKDGAKKIKQAIPEDIDYVFSSEKKYEKVFRENYPKSKHIVIDDKRKTINISSTQIRKNIYGNWEKLPDCVRQYFVKKVAIVGTESCGKTTLTKQLAKFYNTNYVHEVGRDYCEEYSNFLTRDMFDLIAMEHFLLQQKKLKQSNKLIFVDSEAVITKYYLDMYFKGQKSELIDNIIKMQDYDLVIYLEPDIKWVNDGIRFAGEKKLRQKNNEKLKQMYKHYGIEFVTISGNYKQRFGKATGLINKLFKK